MLLLPARRRPPARTSSFLSFYVAWKLLIRCLLLQDGRARSWYSFLPPPCFFIFVVACHQCLWLVADNADFIVVTGKAAVVVGGLLHSAVSASIEAKCAIFNFGTNYPPYFLVSETAAAAATTIIVRIDGVVVAAILSTFFEAVAILILGGRTAMMIDHGLEGFPSSLSFYYILTPRIQPAIEDGRLRHTECHYYITMVL